MPLDPFHFEDDYLRVDGLRIHYRWGGSGPPIVLIHGLIGSLPNWRRNVGHLARLRTVYALDLPNMGASQRVPGLDPSLAAHAHRLDRFLSALQIDSADLVGHSHGAAVVMMFSALYPHRVRSQILFAPSNLFGRFGNLLIRFYQTPPGRWLAHLAPFLPRSIQTFFLKRVYGHPNRVTPETLEGYTAALRIPGTMDHVLAIIARWFPDLRLLTARFRDLAPVPTLFLWGDRDTAVSLRSGRRLQRMIPNSTLTVIPEAGHIAFDEAASLCNHAMQSWLESSRPTPMAAPQQALPVLVPQLPFANPTRHKPPRLVRLLPPIPLPSQPN